MSRYDDYDYDYGRMADDADDLYYDGDENWDFEDDDITNETEWENYYHNIADELSDE